MLAGVGVEVQQTECSKFFFVFFITNALYMKKRNNPKGLIYLFASVCFCHNKNVDEFDLTLVCLDV